ncbi:RDD family protein [Hyphomicrobium sp.]|uniref:RDD family protein n=1 Tax=Hyphomicrobium sp. TaxID=82 RepID=UPI000FB78E17|nr:RDD family protein [Hyphomicrobium sp.]RUP09648.1 MAG: RDD family protein [Hyphomicrobium sp.]
MDQSAPVTALEGETGEEPKYARFTRRIQAMAIDAIIFFASILACLSLVTATNNQWVAWVIGTAFCVALIFYEAAMVAATGGTIGHWRKNLRVVDDRTGGNIGLGKAFIRFIVKSLLGWLSLVAMFLTKRRQAFHDVLTRSTVQIRDASIAETHHYAAADTVFETPGMPSRLRRAIVIFGYMLLTAALLQIVILVLLITQEMSAACMKSNARCSPAETATLEALGLALIGGYLLVLIQGWRGKLFGARAKRAR